VEQAQFVNYRIGDWLFRSELNQLERDGETVRLEPRVGELLAYLAQSANQVISRAQIMETIWPNVVVGDEAINNAINKLRRALGDDSQQPAYIETLPKLGYRLIAPVAVAATTAKDLPHEAAASAESPAEDGLPALRASAGLDRIIAGVAAILILGILSWVYFHGNAPPTDADDKAAPEPVADTATPSILVMPFENIGSDPEDEVFINGVTADIITDLSKLSNLLVIADQTAFSFSNRQVSPRDAGRELEVRYILDGNVRRSGENLRVNVQLIETDTGYSLWANRYDRQLQNIFEIQDEITESIVKALSIRLTSQEKTAIRSIATTDFHAYELFLKGLQKFNSHIREDSESAIADYQQALEIDPGFARVYGALGVVHARNYRLGWTDAPQDTIDRALAYAQKAVAIDDSVPQVYWALGYVHLHRREFAEATAAVEQAIRLAPNYADGFGLLALIQNAQGNWQEAIKNVSRGMQLNPYYSYDYPYNLGRAYYLGGRYDDAIDTLAQALDKNPMAEMPRLYTIASFVRKGSLDDARWEAEQLSVLHPSLSLSSLRRTLSQKPELLSALITDLEQAGVR